MTQFQHIVVLFSLQLPLGFAVNATVRFACYPDCEESWHTIDAEDASTQWWNINWRARTANTTRKIVVAHHYALDGGGSFRATQMVSYVANRLGRSIPRCAELCAGPGYFGFMLLAFGICETMVFVEINPLAIRMLRRTVKRNRLEAHVSIYQSDGLDGVPASERGQWSLVVANPPFFKGMDVTPRGWFPGEAARAVDAGWLLHSRIFQSVNNFLQPSHGHLVFMESLYGSSVETFLPMMHNTGLRVGEVHFAGGDFWYFHVVNAKAWWIDLKGRDVRLLGEEHCRLEDAFGRLTMKPVGCSLSAFQAFRDVELVERTHVIAP